MKKDKRRDVQIEDARVKREVKRVKRVADAEAAQATGAVLASSEALVPGLDEDEEPLGDKVILGTAGEDVDMEVAALPLVPTTTVPLTAIPTHVQMSTLDSSAAASPAESTSVASTPNISRLPSPTLASLSKTTTGTTPVGSLPKKLVTFKAGPQLRGHTSYLTFATLLPTMAPALPEYPTIIAVTDSVAAVEGMVVDSEATEVPNVAETVVEVEGMI